MIRELTPQEVVYNVNFINHKKRTDENYILEYNEVYENIKTALSINKEGYNVYVIDEFSKEKVKNLKSYITEILKENKKVPKDICYVTNNESRNPKSLFTEGGRGKELKEFVEGLKNLYLDKIFNFYHSSSNEEKEKILDDVQKKRSCFISNLVEMAKNEGFELKATTSGFAFIPLKEGEAITEKEYDNLEANFKEEITSKAGRLKINAENVLEKLKEIELNSIKEIKDIYKSYLDDEMKEAKEELKEIFKIEKDALKFLKEMCINIEKEIINIYSMNYDDDEDRINELIQKYGVNVLVDNEGIECSKVIFEEDPSINNLIGTIDYENHNGVYSTDLSLINPGSILKANEGCLIIKVDSLFDNPGSYYYLRKTLMSGKLSYDYNKSHLEFIALNGLKPEPIDINLKVVLIGDYRSFDLLYHYDEDFKKLFRIKGEYNPYKNIDNKLKDYLVSLIDSTSKKNNTLPLTKGAINSIGKYLSRKAGNRNKVFIDDFILDKILNLSNNLAKKEGISKITKNEVKKVIYSEELIEKEIMESFKEGKTMIEVKSSMIGSINALSVINTGYYKFGNPTRVTCICCRGTGKILDGQRESNLSGNIHIKSLNILRGVLNRVINPYKTIPVDFHLSFEQTYGMLDGDSASVAETICMISALSKISIKQNIAVTGSLNQFGEVQPIGGVNEKIEGFFKVCKEIDTVKGKGVLIPYNNKDEIVLNYEVEEAVKNGDFTIYIMKDLYDAIDTLLDSDNSKIEEVLNKIELQLALYGK
ncbi:AAA family ATPase [Clostridium fallax]|uniref:endopeptidase La n=1 Tax=Clostridium fallax TaxID=1533 RepID=A0A1M4UI03_9CLOT|nr:AAA family ATPase [Clostridium fallax]SHE56329.1 Predicted ATP-dependent protease [Clostridium fallax]SQB07573.1 ATP-dependent protease [Clostridium fallax]